MRKILLVVSVIANLSIFAGAQVWNSNAGGWNTGYGTVYGTFGMAMATQNMYNTVQMAISQATMRQAMIKKWGRAAVEKAEREAAARGTANSGNNSGTTTIPVAPPRVKKNLGRFQPDPTLNSAKVLADALGETAQEKRLVTQIFLSTKAAFEREAAAKGLKNNVAGALTLFMATAAMVYHDAEPSDEATDVLADAINAGIDEMPEFGRLTNRQKQGFYDMLIGFSGLLLSGYKEGKQNNDPATLEAYRQLSGELIKLVLKIEPDRLQITDGLITIS
jgi:hypothetical protein